MNDDAELIREGLRAVLRAEGTSGKALEAKAAAARQLAKMEGLMPGDDEDRSGGHVEAPDPMRDLDAQERARQLKLGGAMSAREFLAWRNALDEGESLDELERRLDAAERRRPRRRARRGA